MGLCLGALSRDLDEARNLAVPFLLPQMLFSGYVIPYAAIPSYFKWLYYASFWQYCLGLLQLNEFRDRTYTANCPRTLVERFPGRRRRRWRGRGARLR